MLLIKAAELNNVSHVKALLASKVNPNMQDNIGDTALMWAAYKNNVECINALVKAGADLNIHDIKGRTALYWAVHYNRVEAIKALIKAGANDSGCSHPAIDTIRLSIENQELKNKLKELEETIHELEIRPDGPKYLAYKAHFRRQVIDNFGSLDSDDDDDDDDKN